MLNNSDADAAVTCDGITRNFLMGLLTLNMNDKTKNDVFRLTGALLKQTLKFFHLSKSANEDNSVESLNFLMNLICNDLQKFDSSYKRKQFLERQPSFVMPEQVGIGTHWENERDKYSHILTPVRKQSLFSVISPLDIIK